MHGYGRNYTLSHDEKGVLLDKFNGLYPDVY
jgi:hypothetical protein